MKKALILIAVLAIGLRLWHLGSLFPFTMDEEYQALLAQNILSIHHIPLIGVNIADTGLYLGPLFTYLSALLYFFSHGSPLITAAAAAILGGLTAFSIGWVTFKLAKNKTAAIFAGLFYSLSPLIVMYDKKFWNPSFLPLLGIWGLYSLFKISQKKHPYYLLLALLTGLAWHTHISFFAFTLVGIWFLFKRSTRPSKTILIKSSLIVLFFFLPSILFELRHNFIQLQGLSRYLFSGAGLSLSLNPLLTLLKFISRAFLLPGKDLSQEISLCPTAVSSVFWWSLAVPLFIFIKSYKENKNIYKLIFKLLIAYLITVLIIKPSGSEYYFLSLLPILAVLFGLAFSHRNRLINLTACVFLCFLAWQSINLLNQYGLTGKINQINFIKPIIDQEAYQLKASSDCRQYEGYHYLFSHYFKPPSASYMDQYFDWLYPNRPITSPTYQVIINPGPSVIIESL